MSENNPPSRCSRKRKNLNNSDKENLHAIHGSSRVTNINATSSGNSPTTSNKSATTKNNRSRVNIPVRKTLNESLNSQMSTKELSNILSLNTPSEHNNAFAHILTTNERTPLSCITNNGKQGTSSEKALKINQPSDGSCHMVRKSKYDLSPQDVIPLDLPSPTNMSGIDQGKHPSSSTYAIQPYQKSVTDRPIGRPPKYKFAIHELLPLNLMPTLNNASSSNQNAQHKFNGISTEYLDIGDPIYVCSACKAKLWRAEAMRGNKTFANKAYSLCCMSGKVELAGLKYPPRLLLDLFRGRSEQSKTFIENVRKYNMMFAFTSMGGKIDHKINSGRGPYVYRMHGQNYHLAGSLLPEEGEHPKFSQLYIYDTEHEVENRINAYCSRKDNTMYNPCSDESMTLDELKGLMDSVNPLVQKYRMARDRWTMNDKEPIRLKLIGRRDKDGRTYNLPTANEVAALIVGDIDGFTDKRDIILEKQSKKLKRISELHPLYLALQYPLLFPYAEDGYRSDILHRGVDDQYQSGHVRLTIREFFAYRLQTRVDEVSLILMSRKLLQQFIVDAYTMVENTRLSYIRNNQKTFRVSSLSSLYDAQDFGDVDVSDMGNRVILPSTFTGGARYMQQNYLDAMAIVRAFGYPDLFITLTCNPKWPEVLRFLEVEELNPEDRPDVITRVFKIKLDCLLKKLKDEKVLGGVSAVVYTIKFQKRGLPHCHICLFLDKADKLPNPADIDRVITAEIPDKDEDPKLYEIVSEFMIHGPCGVDNPSCPCMKKGKCSKHFPKDFTNETHLDDDGYPLYKRRDNGNFVQKGNAKLDNRHVVGYNKTLIKQFQAHMNVEWCNQIGSIKYLFKYINKGPDRITVGFESSDREVNKNNKKKNKDEIAEYYSCRYISSCEACWRLYDFPIVYRTPAVYRLSFHLPNHQPIVFDADDDIESVLAKPSVGTSQFLEWMNKNKYDTEARKYTYVKFPREYVWNIKIRKWTKRVGQKTVGRINFVPPKAGETYYLRILLNKVRGPTCFEDIRMVNGRVYDTFKEACYALGLLDDDKEYIESIKETYAWASADFCRSLFVSLIACDNLTRPDHVWKETSQMLSDDLKHKCPPHLRNTDDNELRNILNNLALVEIETMLNRAGSSLKAIPNMPFPDYEYIENNCNMLIHDELNYDVATIQEEHERLYSSMTSEQKSVYQTIMETVALDNGGLFFLYGYGGTGKTFVWKTLAAAIRSIGEIVINVASSGIAALLLTGGRTAHSRFLIPINVTEVSFCSIAPNSELAALLNKTKLIIWDEAPMMHKHCFEAFDRTMRDIIRSNNKSEPFGGKIVVFGGDFRQILPVVQKGTRAEIVHASLHSSHLWRHCKVLRLTKNMRLRGGRDDLEKHELEDFANWILKIGEGKIDEPNDGEADVVFPEDVLIKSNSNHVKTIVDSVYPSFSDHIGDLTYFKDRAILAPTNEEVNYVNDHVLTTMTCEETVYYSSDSLCPDEDDDAFARQLYSPEVLNDIKVPGIPNHRLVLKPGVPIMLLRNIDQSKGLCNGTRLKVERLGKTVIEARIITGSHFGDYTYIPRMVISPTDKKIPVKFRRRQFPVSVCFAMTINKSQGQSLTNVGLFLRKPVFTHGQLYVAVSRVTSKKGLKVLICDEDENTTNTTKNVVYKEVLQRI